MGAGEPVNTVLLVSMSFSSFGAIAYADRGWPRTSRVLTVVAAVSAVAYAATGGPF